MYNIKNISRLKKNIKLFYSWIQQKQFSIKH